MGGWVQLVGSVRIGGMILAVLFAVSLGLPHVSAADWEIDATATVTRIIDGDTFDAVPIGRVRLADIDAPERGEPGAQEATDFLASLISNETVSLDIDDVYGTDIYGRTVCVVYVRSDATHLLNVNRALVDAGLAIVSDYANEFDPATWTTYVDTSTSSPPQASGSNDIILWGASVGIVVAIGVGLARAFLRGRWRPPSRFR